MLKGILQSMGEERTLRMLREKLGVSSDGATPGDVSRLLGKNDLDPAIFGVAEVADENPDAVALLNELGMRLRRAKRWDDAAHHYERALEIMPREPGLLFNFARLKLDLGFVDDAEALLDRMDAESQTQTAVYTLRVAIARSRTSDGAGA
jgi:Flp pilus assembly protein TadD